MASGKSDNNPIQVRPSAFGTMSGPEKKALLHTLAAARNTTVSILINEMVDYWMGLTDDPPSRSGAQVEFIQDEVRVSLPTPSG